MLFKEANLEIDALEPFADFVGFSLALLPLDGRTLSNSTAWREAVAPDFLQFLRSNDELAGVRGDGVPGETRVNSDGTLDVSKWPRPQHDGPAMTAIALLRWLEGANLPGELKITVETLLQVNLEYTRRHWRESCFDIWEGKRACTTTPCGWLRQHSNWALPGTGDTRRAPPPPSAWLIRGK